MRVVSVIALRHRPPPPTTTLTDDDGNDDDDRNEDEDDVDVVVAPRYRVAARRSIETFDRSINQSIRVGGYDVASSNQTSKRLEASPLRHPPSFRFGGTTTGRDSKKRGTDGQGFRGGPLGFRV